jgi:hypothetical protein
MKARSPANISGMHDEMIAPGQRAMSNDLTPSWALNSAALRVPATAGSSSDTERKSCSSLLRRDHSFQHGNWRALLLEVRRSQTPKKNRGCLPEHI